MENSSGGGGFWSDLGETFKESIKSLINAGTNRAQTEIIGRGDVSSFPRDQLESDYYDDENANNRASTQDKNGEYRARNGEYRGFVFNNIPAIYVGAGVLVLVLLLRK